MRWLKSLGSLLVLSGATLAWGGDPPVPPSVEISKISPSSVESSKNSAPPRTLESFQTSPLPTLEKKAGNGAKPTKVGAAIGDPSPGSGRTLPRTLPTAGKSISKRTPIVDPMVRTVSQEESLVPESKTSVPTATSAGATPATRGNVIKPTVEVRQITPPQVTPGTPSPIELTVINQESPPSRR